MLLLGIKFDWPLLFSFLVGIGVGFVLFALIYLVIVLTSINKKQHIVKTKAKDINEEEIFDLIKESQDLFKDADLKGNEALLTYCKNISFELVLNIAKKFFPDSKYPLYEISIDELLMLSVYVSERLDNILDHKGLRMFRRWKVSTIVGLADVKEKIEANSIYKTTKKYKVKEVLGATTKVLNIFNPVYWVKKFLKTTALSIVIRKIGIVVIGIVGEETYKIYSKSVFNKEVSLDTGIDELVEEINDELIDSNVNEPDISNDPKLENKRLNLIKNNRKKV